MLSAHDHRFPFWGMTVTLNIDDSCPQQLRIHVWLATLGSFRALPGLVNGLLVGAFWSALVMDSLWVLSARRCTKRKTGRASLCTSTVCWDL